MRTFPRPPQRPTEKGGRLFLPGEASGEAALFNTSDSEVCENRGEFELSWSFELTMLVSLGAELLMLAR
jgi:hypothetical protein